MNRRDGERSQADMKAESEPASLMLVDAWAREFPGPSAPRFFAARAPFRGARSSSICFSSSKGREWRSKLRGATPPLAE
eukprot:1906622-Pyramimonas_sp.AAC.1